MEVPTSKTYSIKIELGNHKLTPKNRARCSQCAAVIISSRALDASGGDEDVSAQEPDKKLTVPYILL